MGIPRSKASVLAVCTCHLSTFEFNADSLSTLNTFQHLPIQHPTECPCADSANRQTRCYSTPVSSAQLHLQPANALILAVKLPLHSTKRSRWTHEHVQYKHIQLPQSTQACIGIGGSKLSRAHLVTTLIPLSAMQGKNKKDNGATAVPPC
eukprot:671622-Pelagomonas_calceolata.AAC.3